MLATGINGDEPLLGLACEHQRERSAMATEHKRANNCVATDAGPRRD